jgi:hypothetical protein
MQNNGVSYDDTELTSLTVGRNGLSTVQYMYAVEARHPLLFRSRPRHSSQRVYVRKSVRT